MKIKKLKNKVIQLSIAGLMFISLCIPVQCTSVHAAQDSQLTAFENQMNKVKELNFDNAQDLSDVREPVVYARHLYDKLSKDQKKTVNPDMLKLLTEDEAKVLNKWIDTLLPLDSYADSGMSWVIDEQYETIEEALNNYGEDIKNYVPNYAYLNEFYENVIPKLQVKKRDDYAKAMEVEKIFNEMQVLKLSDKQEAVNARKAYDALTNDQKAFVSNYELLKDAENNIAKWEGKEFPHTAPTNIIYSGTRSSAYGPGQPWLTKDQWGSLTDDMKEYFPNSQSTMVWIIGSLSGSGVNLEFDKPDFITDEWLAEKDYRSLENINFKNPSHDPHEDYLNYFDEHNIKVYLQVESGYSDMRTLMDIIMQKYGHHKCIAGFGVDVEWYWGVNEDSGLPITDTLAEQWDKHLKELNPNYRLFLKHYNANYLPSTYRSDIIFVNDSQSFGSINGDALGQYDENLDDILGFVPEFKQFADTFAPNDVIYQIGYAPDRMWYYTLEDSVIQSLGEKLAEATSQNCGIAWVDFTLKDPLTFPQLLDSNTKVNKIKGLVGYFRNSGSNMVGKRFANGEATYRDALFVKRVNSLIQSLTSEEQSQLWASMTSDNDKKAINGYQKAQDLAIDIRIKNLPETLRTKDIETIQELQADFDRLTDEQKALVENKIPDISSIVPDTPDDPVNPDKPVDPTKLEDSDKPNDNNHPSVVVTSDDKQKSNVKTGDSYPIVYYTTMAFVAASGLYIFKKQSDKRYKK